MFRSLVASLALFVCLAMYVAGPPATVSAQQPLKIDFGRDVQPIFRQHCFGCHGPDQQMNGFRLDRRSDAMRGGTIPVIGAGNAAGSRMYLRLTGNRYGMQMPPTGALRPEEIEIIRNWIDQGAEWPDALAGEVPRTVPDPAATRIIDAIRTGDQSAFLRTLDAEAGAINKKGAAGASPLMWAALDGDVAAVRVLLERAADPNVANDAGATALMWAVPDLAKVTLLLERGADVNARSTDGRTALLVAAGVRGAAPVVKLLLDRGANASHVAPGLLGPVTALVEAAYVGDADIFRMLLERGSDPKLAGPAPLVFALRANCTSCIDVLLKFTPPPLLSVVAMITSPPIGPARATRLLLDRGADPNMRDADGRTLLMLAASSDALPVDSVRALLDKGADVHATSPRGETALGLASLRGQTAIVDALIKAGAKPAPASEPALKPVPAVSARAAVERSLPLLQRSDAAFLNKSGCVSCHNNTLTAESVALARRAGIAVNDAIAREHKTKIANYLETWRERALQGVGIPGDASTISYILMGLAAENHPPDATTDAMVRFILNKRAGDHWFGLAHRPPIATSDVDETALAIRALQLYTPKRQRVVADAAIARAAVWLGQAPLSSTQERAFQILGLRWANQPLDAVRSRARDLIATQRPDGGWAQLATLSSDAYATGQALVALLDSGAVGGDDAAIKKGVQFLLNTQLADGSWYVRTRALPIQPFFEADFPHGRSQFISAAATNWATLALVRSLNSGGRTIH